VTYFLDEGARPSDRSAAPAIFGCETGGDDLVDDHDLSLLAAAPSTATLHA
jgi:hypothetical protein